MDLESSFELIQRAQDGDSLALNHLLTRYRPRLRRWATGRLPRFARELADTEDIVQDALVGTVRNFKAFELRGEWALQGYLRQAVGNRIRDELRRHAARPPRETVVELPSNERSPLESIVGQEQFARYEAALSELDEVEREAVIGRIELGLSWAEVAALIQKPTPDAARIFVSRALAKVASRMR